MSCRVQLCKVSKSRTGQGMSILKLAPGLLSKGEGKLIRRKGEQVPEFAHQIGFRQSLGCNREGDPDFLLAVQGSSSGRYQNAIRASGCEGSCRDSSHSPQGRAARWPVCAETSGRSPGTQRRGAGRASPLPIRGDTSDPSALPLDRPVRELDPATPHWE